jgi:NAD-dependent dihydropyrimidine dehydrogenase PreA subunit/tetratricopeptide (TPR) repeat protein
LHGLTLSPVEPSETMYTFELGEVNAGAIMFLLAMASVLVFGRFFCGWACHVVALQDLCAHFMTKLGMRPKPIRTRLLFWWSTLLALYMFIWPTLRREALEPIAAKFGIALPAILGRSQAFPGFHNALIVEDFWATFPEWYVAVPFLLFCGFGAVYVLGSKGFCTYACPYGGFFAPLDRFSIGRIVVSDACEQCGHCTAACTSNVRVHEEVRDYGMVMDPGCMKCLDCVSVCPNDALSFRFATPAAFTKQRTTTPATSRFDLTLREESVVFVLGIALCTAFRGMFNQVPLLLAAALGACLSVVWWKLYRAFRGENVRLQSLRLRTHGRYSRAGVFTLLVAIGATLLAAWGGHVRTLRYRADAIDATITAAQDQVFAPGYKPDPTQESRAGHALALWELSGPEHRGWAHRPATLVRMTWAACVMGDFAKAHLLMERAIALGEPGDDAVMGLVRIARARGVSELEALDRVLQSAGVVAVRAELEAARGENDRALELARQVFKEARRAPDASLARAGSVMVRLGKANEAWRLLKDAAQKRPTAVEVRATLAAAAMVDRNPSEAVRALEQVTRLRPREAEGFARLSQAYSAAGRTSDAAAASTRAKGLGAR